ncbi:MAG: TIM barrel protein [Chloroflexi bacterium]|nr:TIM barrel protein [Chloroflexota bacterium]
MIDQYHRVAERAHSAGLAVHVHPNSSAQSRVRFRAEYDRLVADLDPALVGFGPDTGHVPRGGEEPLALVARHIERITHLHVKDAYTNGDYAFLGSGDVGIPAIIGLLRERGYAGWIVAAEESEEGLRDPVATLSRSRAYLRGQGIDSDVLDPPRPGRTHLPGSSRVAARRVADRNFVGARGPGVIWIGSRYGTLPPLDAPLAPPSAVGRHRGGRRATRNEIRVAARGGTGPPRRHRPPRERRANAASAWLGTRRARSPRHRPPECAPRQDCVGAVHSAAQTDRRQLFARCPPL